MPKPPSRVDSLHADPLLYALVHIGNAGDAAFYRRVCEGVGSILELGCGHGRVLEGLIGSARRVTGVDLHPGLLALAANRLREACVDQGAALDLVCADMCSFESSVRFDRIIIPYSGLYVLLDEARVSSALKRARDLVSEDGRLALDVYCADGFHHDARPEDHDDAHLDEVALVASGGRVYDVFERSSWDRAGQRMTASYVHRPDGAGEELVYSIEHHYLLRDQLEGLLAGAGWAVESIDGDFCGGDWDRDGDLTVLTARPV